MGSRLAGEIASQKFRPKDCSRDMSRLFEESHNRVNEKQVIDWFIKEKGLDLQVKKLDNFTLDFLLHKGDKKVAYVEVKCFNSTFKQFPSIVVSERKYEKMRAHDYIPVYFMVSFSCGTIAWIEVNKIKGTKALMKRNVMREGATNDEEIMIFVKRRLFKTIK